MKYKCLGCISLNGLQPCLCSLSSESFNTEVVGLETKLFGEGRIFLRSLGLSLNEDIRVNFKLVGRKSECSRVLLFVFLHFFLGVIDGGKGFLSINLKLS